MNFGTEGGVANALSANVCTAVAHETEVGFFSRFLRGGGEGEVFCFFLVGGGGVSHLTYH